MYLTDIINTLECKLLHNKFLIWQRKQCRHMFEYDSPCQSLSELELICQLNSTLNLSLGDVYELTQHLNINWTEQTAYAGIENSLFIKMHMPEHKCRSASINDLVQIDNIYFRIMPYGWYPYIASNNFLYPIDITENPVTRKV